MATTIHTIGHSNHGIDAFLAILGAHRIEVLVDVRSVPWSRRWPWFRKAALARAVRERGLEYLHLGATLGGRAPGGRAAPAADFTAAVERVVALARARRVAVMCAEADPARCHRASLLAPAFEAGGARVLHLLAADRVEDHTVTAARAGAATAVTGDLFGP